MQSGGARRRVNTNPIHIGVPPMPTNQQVLGSGNSSVGEIDPNNVDVGMDDRAALKHAVNAFRINLGLDDDVPIRDVIHLKDIPAGAYLAKEDSQQVQLHVNSA